MSASSQNKPNRRQDVRLAGGGQVDATILDRAGQPSATLEDAKVLNVSAGGMAIASPTPTQQGDMLVIGTGHPASPKVVVEALECSDYFGDRHRIRCQVVEGRVPGSLIHGW